MKLSSCSLPSLILFFSSHVLLFLDVTLPKLPDKHPLSEKTLEELDLNKGIRVIDQSHIKHRVLGS